MDRCWYYSPTISVDEQWVRTGSGGTRIDQLLFTCLYIIIMCLDYIIINMNALKCRTLSATTCRHNTYARLPTKVRQTQTTLLPMRALRSKSRACVHPERRGKARERGCDLSVRPSLTLRNCTLSSISNATLRMCACAFSVMLRIRPLGANREATRPDVLLTAFITQLELPAAGHK